MFNINCPILAHYYASPDRLTPETLKYQQNLLKMQAKDSTNFNLKTGNWENSIRLNLLAKISSWWGSNIEAKETRNFTHISISSQNEQNIGFSKLRFQKNIFPVQMVPSDKKTMTQDTHSCTF